MTIQQIKAQEQEKTDQLLRDCSVFFAFSDEQFQKNKTPLQEGEKYVSIGAGGYLPKSKVEQLQKGFKDIAQWKKDQLKENKLRKQHIAYELANHEAFYTGEIEDTLDALGEGYTYAEVWEVFKAERKKQVA